MHLDEFPASPVEGRCPQDLLRWSLDRFEPRIAPGTGFAAEGVVLIPFAHVRRIASESGRSRPVA
jgi:hypothetical protein